MKNQNSAEASPGAPGLLGLERQCIMTVMRLSPPPSGGLSANFADRTDLSYLTQRCEELDIFGCPNTTSLIWSFWRRARSCGNSPSSSLGLLPSSISTIVVSLSSPFMES
ncbi:hypothetical protein LR48_Vigan01g282200 [Vigna angularis]|uniref:Uncharacterized protein n=1 Tax=Phaseolus angularis TaxID=3914 RepID=A0A0L9TRZ5_PHAAN|nr:hypothetical protein LR48_Vigan01g282200 [Vigna angularis]